jgi:hypothetical protein
MVEFNYGESGDVEDAENEALIHPNQRSTHIRLVRFVSAPILFLWYPYRRTKHSHTHGALHSEVKESR